MAELYKFAIGEGHRQVIGAQQGKYVRSVRKSDSQRKKNKVKCRTYYPTPLQKLEKDTVSKFSGLYLGQSSTFPMLVLLGY